MKAFFRLVLLCVCGAVIVFSALRLREGAHPEAAPPEVQQAGKDLLRQQLDTIRHTAFGKSPRGQMLSGRISGFLSQDRIIFTSDIVGGEKALCRTDLFGAEIWYIEVTCKDGRYVHQLPHQLAEVVFHEALHSVKGGFNTASIEEECDAFVAGHQAEAACQGLDPKDVVTLEDVPVAQFVARRYVGLEHKPDYVPVEQSLKWLQERSGL